MSKHHGIPMEDWRKKDKPRSIHTNWQQPWKVNKDGSITDAMFS
jgi:hypothetical protein